MTRHEATVKCWCDECARHTLHVRDGGLGCGHIHCVCLRCRTAPCCGEFVPQEVRRDEEGR